MLRTFSRHSSLALSAEQPELLEPLGIGDVRNYLRLDDGWDNELIALLISAAREQAELFQHRVLVRKSFDLNLSSWSGEVELPVPTASIDLVQVTDHHGSVLSLTAGEGYEFQSPYLRLKQSNDARSVLIRFTAGFSPVDPFWSHAGARLKAGMLLLISQWYTQRLPFVVGTTTELPFAVRHCFSEGALRIVR